MAQFDPNSVEMEGEPDSNGGVRLTGDDGSVDLHGHVALGGDQILVENKICDPISEQI